jgi:preprotein translocase subunit SecG
MQEIILIFHILFAVALIALILIQQGKGATMGSSFGAGASQTVFGSQGSASFLVKLTGGLALLFFATSLILSYLASREVRVTQSLNALTVASQISQLADKSSNQSVPTKK